MLKNIYRKTAASIDNFYLKRALKSVADALIALAVKVSNFKVPQDRSLMSMQMLAGTWESGVRGYIENNLGRGETFVDVGAHIGYFSTFAAKEVGASGKVYAFEADPINFDMLQENAKKYSQIEPVNKAVSKDSGNIDFFVSNTGTGSHSLIQEREESGKRITVSAVTLDEFFSEEVYTNIDLMKIDVEGAEMDVLQGMTDLLSGADSLQIIFEYYPDIFEKQGKNPLSLLNLLSENDFEIHVLRDDTDKISEVIDPGTFKEFSQSIDKHVNMVAVK